VPIPDGVEVAPVRVQVVILPIEVKCFEQDVVRDEVDFRGVYVSLACVHDSLVLGYRRKRDVRTSRHHFRCSLAQPFCGVSGLGHSDIRY
jgi:hypothetical protein